MPAHTISFRGTNFTLYLARVCVGYEEEGEGREEGGAVSEAGLGRGREGGRGTTGRGTTCARFGWCTWRGWGSMWDETPKKVGRMYTQHARVRYKKKLVETFVLGCVCVCMRMGFVGETGKNTHTERGATGGAQFS